MTWGKLQRVQILRGLDGNHTSSRHHVCVLEPATTQLGTILVCTRSWVLAWLLLGWCIRYLKYLVLSGCLISVSASVVTISSRLNSSLAYLLGLLLISHSYPRAYGLFWSPLRSEHLCSKQRPRQSHFTTASFTTAILLFKADCQREKLCFILQRELMQK